MAQQTIDEEIIELEAELTVHKASITNQANLGEVEEGGSQAKFRTRFDNTTLIKRIKELEARLSTLYAAKSGGLS